jgi:hypothetical protein
MNWDPESRAEEKKKLMEKEWLGFKGLGAGPLFKHMSGLMQIICANGSRATVIHKKKRPNKPHIVVAKCCGNFQLTVLAFEDRLVFQPSGEHAPAEAALAVDLAAEDLAAAAARAISPTAELEEPKEEGTGKEEH